MSTGEVSEAMVLHMVRKNISLALSLSILVSIAFGAGAQAVPPKKSMVLFNQANSLSGHGKYKEAVDKYKEALSIEPGNGFFYHMYGRTLAHMGLLQDAVTQYKQSMTLSKPSAELYNDIGVALANLGDYAEAACNLKKAVTINPKFIAAYNNLGVALENLGDYKQARDVFKTSLKLQPTNKMIELRHEKVFSKLGESKPFDFNAAAAAAASTQCPTTEATTAESGMPTDGNVTRTVTAPTKDESVSPTRTVSGDTPASKETVSVPTKDTKWVPSAANTASTPSGVTPPVSAVTPAAQRKFDEQTRPGGSAVDPGTLGISTTITPTKSSSGTETKTTTIRTTTTTVPESKIVPGVGSTQVETNLTQPVATPAIEIKSITTRPAPDVVPADGSATAADDEAKPATNEAKAASSETATDSGETKPEVKYAAGAKNVPTTDDEEEEKE